ncbi:MAG: hypothetical protein ACLU38_05405 [Dysosmobacter sp.]
MNSINIVPMTADHLDALEQLERTCFSRPWSRKMLAEELDNECAAFLVAGVTPPRERRWADAGLLVAADEGYITNVAVFPRIAAGAWPGSCWTCSCALPGPTTWPF